MAEEQVIIREILKQMEFQFFDSKFQVVEDDSKASQYAISIELKNYVFKNDMNLTPYFEKAILGVKKTIDENKFTKFIDYTEDNLVVKYRNLPLRVVIEDDLRSRSILIYLDFTAVKE